MKGKNTRYIINGICALAFGIAMLALGFTLDTSLISALIVLTYFEIHDLEKSQ